jgi:hypothetical protein
MATSIAATVDEYLAELPPDRREVISKFREVILEDLPLDLIGEKIAALPPLSLLRPTKRPGAA